MRILFEQDNYRIVEHADEYFDLENLEGGTYNPAVNPDIPAEQLEQEQREFHDLVNHEGVFGYVLEVWNPAVNGGWEHVDSCWGFVGQYSEHEELFNHYIVDELKAGIPENKQTSRG